MASMPLPETASVSHLTAALRRAGVLGAGTVVGLDVVASRRKARSRTLRLRPSYAGAPPSAPLTLVHGDAHWRNCLVPRDGTDDVRLIDWEDLIVGPATADLAYMMAMLWSPDRRQAFEGPLLDAHHEALTQAGVTSFCRKALGQDYRWSVALQMLRPVWQAAAGLPARVWWPNLERNFLAFDDLGCEDLLG